jgi:SpoIID/LytB domain protein
MRSTSLLLAGLVAVSGTVVPATVAMADSWKVPVSAKVTIKGHGYGHGHGMSQYGAEGAARRGLGYGRIVKFYYPGTSWGRSHGSIKVLISGDTTNDLVVQARRGLSVRDLAGKRRITLPRNGAKRWKVARQGGANRVLFHTNRWHRWKTLRGQGEFYAHGNPIRLYTPSGARAYRGRLRTAVASGSRVTVNVVTLEGYLKGVVPWEMPASWHPAAVRSQAVAARTYAAYERAHPRSSAYQICDTTACQVYGGYDAEQAASNRAVDATAHRILLAGGNPAFTQFGSSSGGWTSKGSMRYLPAKRDPYDGWSGNPVHSWSVRVTDKRIQRHWPRIGNLNRIAVTMRDGHGAWGGRAESITLRGGRGKVTMSGDTFRYRLGLRSTWVTFRISKR